MHTNLLIIGSLLFSVSSFARHFTAHEGDTITCPIFMIHADKSTGIKNSSPSDLVLTFNNGQFPTADNGNCKPNSDGACISIIDWGSDEPSSIYQDGELIYHVGFMDDQNWFSNTGFISWILNKRNTDYLPGYNFGDIVYSGRLHEIVIDRRVWLKMYAVKNPVLSNLARIDGPFFNPYRGGHPDQIDVFAELLKEAIARGIVKDGDLVATGTGRECTFKSKGR